MLPIRHPFLDRGISMPTTTEHHQKCTIKAKAWTPIHIGSGLEAGRWEYFFSKDDQLVYLDYDKLATEAIHNEELIEELTKAAAKDPSGSLHKFLRSVEASDPDIRDRIGSSTRQRPLPIATRKIPADERSIRHIRLFNGSPRCYVPGGSIKGALRTALLSSSIANASVKEELLPRDPSADDYSNLRMLRERLAKTFRPQTEETRFFQGILVRDCAPIDASNLGIASVRIFGSPKKSKQKEQVSSDEYAEVLLAGSDVQIEMSLRFTRLQKSTLRDMREILSTADKFFRRVWEENRLIQNELAKLNKADKDILDFYESSAARVPEDFYLLRVGYGSGQVANSVLLEYKEHFSKTMPNWADAPLRHSTLYMRKRTDLKKRKPYPFTSRSAWAGELDQGRPLGWLVLSKDL